MKLIKNCELCGKEFKTYTYLIERGHGRFCSLTCFHKQRIAPTGEKAYNWQGGQVKRKCLICGKVFYVDPHVAKKGYGNFCSKSCTGKRTYGKKELAPRTKLTCKVCGKEFEEYTARMKSDKTRGKCCSVECRIEYTKRRNSGKNSYRWKGGITEQNKLERSQMATRNWCAEVKKRDDYTCQTCGKRGGRLHSHHIKKWSKNITERHNLDNGITLCIECHKKVHRSKNAKSKVRSVAGNTI